MSEYIEIKRLLTKLLLSNEEISEDDDIIVKLDDEDIITVKNSWLKESYEEYIKFQQSEIEIYNDSYREVAIQNNSMRMYDDISSCKHNETDNYFEISEASLNYCFFILDKLVDSFNISGNYRIPPKLRLPRVIYRRFLSDNSQIEKLLPNLLRINTIKTTTKKAVSVNELRNLTSSFSYVAMYNRSVPIIEYSSVLDIYSLSKNRFPIRITENSKIEPPRRVYNSEVLCYYSMALNSEDPFTAYISYYHVIEYYFAEIFKDNMSEMIKKRITDPSFSYSKKDDLFDLALLVTNNMKSEDETGKGDEKRSLKYVLEAYVDIKELMNRIDFLSPSFTDYYKNHPVPFITKKQNSTRINWEDSNNVYAHLTTRIYKTRNALIHSKSTEKENTYIPYKNKTDLENELCLVRSVAEIIINSTAD